MQLLGGKRNRWTVPWRFGRSLGITKFEQRAQKGKGSCCGEMTVFSRHRYQWQCARPSSRVKEQRSLQHTTYLLSCGTLFSYTSFRFPMTQELVMGTNSCWDFHIFLNLISSSQSKSFDEDVTRNQKRSFLLLLTNMQLWGHYGWVTLRQRLNYQITTLLTSWSSSKHA